jgi:hypothetical protein
MPTSKKMAYIFAHINALVAFWLAYAAYGWLRAFLVNAVLLTIINSCVMVAAPREVSEKGSEK